MEIFYFISTRADNPDSEQRCPAERQRVTNSAHVAVPLVKMTKTLNRLPATRSGEAKSHIISFCRSKFSSHMHQHTCEVVDFQHHKWEQNLT